MTVLLALALALAADPKAGSQTATPKAAQIEKLTLDGKADDAIEQGRPAVAAHPDDLDLRLALARALAAKARHVKRQVNVPVSQQDVDKGQVAVPAADLASGPSRVEYDSGPFEEAMLHLDYAIKRAPKRQDLRIFQCFLLTDSGRIDRAKAAITSALAALPKSPGLAATMAAYGAERAKRDDPAGGAQLLAPVAEAFPKEASVLVDYGNVLTRLGKKAESYAAFDRAIALAPQEVRYLRTKAVSAMLLRDYRRAQNGFNAAFQQGRGVADQFASYVAAYGADPKLAAEPMRKLGAPGPATDPMVADYANGFVRAAKGGPASADAMTLARKLVGAGQHVFAIPVLDRALHAEPNNAEAKALLTTAYTALGCAALAP